MSTYPSTTVIGGGAWGSTLADLLARKGVAVTIWDRAPAALEKLARDRCPFGLPDLRLPESVRFEAILSNAVNQAEVIVIAIASQAIGSLATELAHELGDKMPLIVLASKGIDIESLSPLSDVVKRAMPAVALGVVSGPCIALEVARGIPTSAVVATENVQATQAIQNLFATKSLRIYAQDDVLGVELGGALKNIIAIAAGIGDGLGFGANSKAALMTRGLAEMARLASAMGASSRTVFGLSGLGDLAVTCFSPHSRNRTFGEHLGKGLGSKEARAAIGMIVEGEPTARAALKLAGRHGIELPITEAVVRVCDGEWSGHQAVTALMSREPKEEFWSKI